MKISELTKDQLLGLIYHFKPDTLWDVHPCYCAACGKDYIGEKVIVEGREATAYPIICNDCEEKEENEK